MTIADGDFAESLDDILGSIIRTDPRLFLQELQNHHSLIRDLEGLLNSGGDDSTNRKSDWKKEHQERVKAFQTRAHIGAFLDYSKTNILMTAIHFDYFDINKNFLWHILETCFTRSRPTSWAGEVWPDH